MKIAVCDDDKNDIITIQYYLSKYDSSLQVDAFSSAVDLIKAMEFEFYDLIFLDIQMKPLNGFEAAKIIMEKYEDKPLIVFTTKSSKYSIRGYEVAFRYLVKPVTYEGFLSVITSALKKISPQKINIMVNGSNFFISVNEICYCEVFDHYTMIYTKDKSYECRYPLKSLEDMLQGCSFIRPHSSYLINLDYIESAAQTEVTLKNGLKIKISRNKKDDFTKAFHQFLRR